MPQIPVTTIYYKNRQIDILRLDLAFPDGEGNKYYKLKYNLEEARHQQKDTLLTFGGAFSNHIYAVAQAGHKSGFKTIGIVRGEDDPNNPTLQAVRGIGMEVHNISRMAYKLKDTLDLLRSDNSGDSRVYLIPEGGTNALAVRGTMEILQHIHHDYDQIFCGVGTGGTLAGIISTPGLKAKITGISSLKGVDTISSVIQQLLVPSSTPFPEWEIDLHYNFGGFARYDETLLSFIDKLYKSENILPDPIYSARVLFAVFDKIDKQMIAPDTKILAIHTGGMQGWNGWNYRFKHKLEKSGFGPFAIQ